MRWRALCAFVAALAALSPLMAQNPSQPAQAASIDSKDFRDADFFQQTRIWRVQLTFTADEWRAMQPRGGTASGFGFGGGLQGAEGSRNGVAARQGIVFDYVHADLAIDGRTFPDVGVRYKGNGSYLRARGTNKISLKVDLNKYHPDQKLAGLSTINLQNNITDISWMNEVLAYQLYRDAGVPAPRSSYARVYVTVPGQYADSYFGLYSISENVDTNFTAARFATRKGAILKPSTRAPFTDLGAAWPSYNQTYDPKTTLTDAEQQRIIEFCQFVSHASDADFVAKVEEYVDLDLFARYFAVLVWIANPDSLLQIGQNYYVYLHPATHKLLFIPWDQDASFGNFRMGGGFESRTIFHPWSTVNPMLERIYKVDAFRNAYLDYMAEFTNTIFRPERFAAQMAAIAPVLRPAVEEEGAMWLPGFDAVANGSSGILPFAKARAAFVTSQLVK